MAKTNLKKATINEERAEETTIEECLYLIITELTKNIDEIDINESVA